MVFIINRKKYRGFGRPRKSDYHSEKKSLKILGKIIGEPPTDSMHKPLLDLNKLI